MSSELNGLLCSLCGSPAPSSYAIEERPLTFCCMGCRAVYHILKAQQVQGDWSCHPLFAEAVKEGIIANPHFVQQSSAPSFEEIEKYYLEIQGMWCPFCADLIRWTLQKHPGVMACYVDYSTDLACIEYNPRKLSKKDLDEHLKKWGYRPASLEEASEGKQQASHKLRFLIVSFCTLNIMMFAYPVYASYFDLEGDGYATLFAWLSFAFSLPLITYGIWPVLRRFVQSCKIGAWSTDCLVITGVFSAFALSSYELFSGRQTIYYDSMAVILMALLLGKILEEKAKFSLKTTFWRLARSLPKRARKCLEGGAAAFVSLQEVAVGDVLWVYGGEKVALDGVIIEGEGIGNEAMMTGESMPLFKQKGDRVLGGTVLQQGEWKVRVKSLPGQSALHQIVSSAQLHFASKPSDSPLTQRVVRWLIPFLFVLVLGTCGVCWWRDIHTVGETALQTGISRALATLLIACPCAIGIAVPLAESALLHRLAALGGMVKRRGCLAYLGKETAYVFDKTGTLTSGRLEVLEGLEALSTQDLSILKALTAASFHPLAHAVHLSLSEIVQAPDLQVKEHVGKGLQGEGRSDVYWLGSRAFLFEQGIVCPENHKAAEGDLFLTELFFAARGRHCATLVLGDQPRPGVASFIRELSQEAAVYLLSGDGTPCVEAIANHCGIQKWKAQCTPEQKRAFVHALIQEGNIVAMIGDGVNDAPAMAQAHIAVAMHAAADVASHVADIQMVSGQMEPLLEVRKVAHHGRKIAKQNLFWAFAYNLVGIGLAVFGLLTPIYAAFAMVMSSLMVILNAKRLMKTYPSKIKNPSPVPLFPTVPTASHQILFGKSR